MNYRLCFSILLVISALPGAGAAATMEYFPQNIFALRPLRVRPTQPGDENLQERFALENIPRVPQQNELTLTEADNVSVVFPDWHRIYHSYQLQEGTEGNRLVVIVKDVISAGGKALSWPYDHILPMGKLAAGNYTMVLRHEYWEYRRPSRDKFSQIDLRGPVSAEPALSLHSSHETTLDFSVLAVPEPSTLMLAALGVTGIACASRVRRKVTPAR